MKNPENQSDFQRLPKTILIETEANGPAENMSKAGSLHYGGMPIQFLIENPCLNWIQQTFYWFWNLYGEKSVALPENSKVVSK